MAGWFLWNSTADFIIHTYQYTLSICSTSNECAFDRMLNPNLPSLLSYVTSHIKHRLFIYFFWLFSPTLEYYIFFFLWHSIHWKIFVKFNTQVTVYFMNNNFWKIQWHIFHCGIIFVWKRTDDKIFHFATVIGSKNCCSLDKYEFHAKEPVSVKYACTLSCSESTVSAEMVFDDNVVKIYIYHI